MTNCDITYDELCCRDCTKSLCLDIKKKMSNKEKFYSLVKRLNVEEEYNEENLYEISTNFIRKLTDFFFILICKKVSTNIPLNMMYYKKNANLICLFGPVYLHLDEYPPSSDINVIILRQKLLKT